VYVDYDPVVLAHARALLVSRDQGTTAYIDADLRDTDRILAAAAELLDFSQPVGSTVVGFVLDTHGPRAGYVLAACLGALALLVSLTSPRVLRIGTGRP
jgi:hypothetical protein